MQVRHNTELLEQAVDLMVKRSGIPALAAEAAAHDKMERATGFRRLATGGAVALAAVGLGIGAALFFNSQIEQIAKEVDPTIQQSELAKPEPGQPTTSEPVAVPPLEPSQADAQQPENTPPKSDVVTVDFTKFATRKLDFLGGPWELMAGHYYADESDEIWQHAWCYTNRNIQGVDVSITLMNRSAPDAVPVGPISPPETLALAGLEDRTALELAQRCPWLDGRSFSSADIAPSPNRKVSEPQLPPETSQIVDPNQLVVAEGFDAIGNDLPNMPLQGTSLAECQDACTRSTNCAAATYNTKYKACFLKGDAKFLVASDDAVAFAKERIRDRLRKSNLVFETKTEIMGLPLASRRETYPDCIIACASEQSCQGFNYRQKDQVCTLFGTTWSSRANQEVTSAIRTGAEEMVVTLPRAKAKPDGFWEMLNGQ